MGSYMDLESESLGDPGSDNESDRLGPPEASPGVGRRNRCRTDPGLERYGRPQPANVTCETYSECPLTSLLTLRSLIRANLD